MFLLLTIPALSLSAQTSSNMLPALAPAYGEMKPTFWEQHGVIVVVIACLVVISAGLLIWLMLHPAPPVAVPPETVAREALTRLSRQPENGKVLSEISQALRRYVVAALKLPPGELTTREFNAVLSEQQSIEQRIGAGDLPLAGRMRPAEIFAREPGPRTQCGPARAGTGGSD